MKVKYFLIILLLALQPLLAESYESMGNVKKIYGADLRMADYGLKLRRHDAMAID